jgi:hypothetical protein
VAVADGVLGPGTCGPGYFVCTSGNVTDEVIAEYIELEGAEPRDAAAFKVIE